MGSKNRFGKDFILMIIGQIISLFGNAILRFILSLYVLETTHSATIFGGILAVSMIPSVLISPMGGILADRVNRRNIMVGLDFITSALVVGFALLLQIGNPILLIAIVMILLGCIQSFYQPSVQASIPSLVDEKHLIVANGMVTQVSALANLFGPIIGGLLYALIDMTWILVISGLCFLISAIMECFITIPFIKKVSTQGILKMVIGDTKAAIHFLRDEQPILFKMLVVIAALNLFLSALLTVGLPYILKVTLKVGSGYYGFAQSALAIGSIAGALLSGIANKKINMKQSYLFLVVTCLGLIPIAIGGCLTQMPMLAYVMIIFGEVICIMFSTLFNIFCITFVQRYTPNDLMGKILAFAVAIATCAFPLGQAMYGVLFDVLKSEVWLVVVIGTLLSLLITLIARDNLKRVEESETTI